MYKIPVLVFALTSLIASPALQAKDDATARLESAADLLQDMMKASDKGVPQDLLNKARCVILVPGLKKAAFVLGAKYGRGFAVCRREGGEGWTAPAAVRIEGGSVAVPNRTFSCSS
jgi:lipid-binding SYLF domain-containing protein